MEFALSELSTLDSFKVGLNQATRGVSTSLSIASEGMQAALMAREVSNAQKKHMKKQSDERYYRTHFPDETTFYYFLFDSNTTYILILMVLIMVYIVYILTSICNVFMLM